MLVQYGRMLAASMKEGVEDVPEYKIKTPLQKAIQILKRHRDIMFYEKDDKPISIIITTLAAHAYENEPDLFEALTNIVDGMKGHIYQKNGVYWVSNPVDPRENFADKWAKYPQRAENFINWLAQVRLDFESIIQKGDTRMIEESLQASLGKGGYGKAIEQGSAEFTNAIHVSREPASVVEITDPSPPWGNFDE